MALRISTPPVQDEAVVLSGNLMTASGTVYVRADCNKFSPATSSVDWRVKSNKAHSVAFYKTRTNVLGGTITLADATPVDDGDTFLLNGYTLTAEDTEGEATGTKYYSGGADEIATATALAACINANVPGVLATAAARIVTLSTVATGSLPDGARTLLFQQGTSAANEIAFASTTLAGLMKDGATTTGVGDNSTTSGALYTQYADGYPYCWVGITDTSAAESTLTVGYGLHDSL